MWWINKQTQAEKEEKKASHTGPVWHSPAGTQTDVNVAETLYSNCGQQRHAKMKKQNKTNPNEKGKRQLSYKMTNSSCKCRQKNNNTAQRGWWDRALPFGTVVAVGLRWFHSRHDTLYFTIERVRRGGFYTARSEGPALALRFFLRGRGLFSLDFCSAEGYVERLCLYTDMQRTSIRVM